MTVTVRAALQSAGVKVSDGGPTVAAVVSSTEGVTVTAPVGSRSSATVYVALPPASATVRTGADRETVTPGTSVFVTVTATFAAVAAS